jgi:hypothetical protein
MSILVNPEEMRTYTQRGYPLVGIYSAYDYIEKKCGKGEAERLRALPCMTAEKRIAEYHRNRALAGLKWRG